MIAVADDELFCWIKVTFENPWGAPSRESYEYDQSEPYGTFHGMWRTIMVSLHYAPATLLAIPPTLAVLRGPLRRWRRRRKGLCLKCGYDLKGNVSGTCPECGTKIPEQSKTGRSRVG